MKPKYNYKTNYMLIAYVVIVSLLLQSCGNISNISIRGKREYTNNHHHNVTKQLIGQELAAKGGHIVTFYEQEGLLKADVKINAPEGFSKTYKQVKVYIEQDTELASLVQLDTQLQQRHIYFQHTKDKKPARVIIYKFPGLQGGMKEEEHEAFIPEKEVTYETGELAGVPVEIWNYVLSYLSYKEILATRQVNKPLYKLITGYDQYGIVGVDNIPTSNIPTNCWVIDETIYFNSNTLMEITIDNIPSFFFYRLLGQAKNLPQIFWPYIPNSQVYTIDLSGNNIGASGAAELAKILPKSKIHTINLSCNEIGASGAAELAKVLPNSQVHTIDLGSNQIRDSGALEFAKILPNSQIHTIDLSGNNIGDIGAIQLAKAFANSRVHTINLSMNQIEDSGAIELARTLHNSKINSINLSENYIGDSGAIELAKFLPNSQVHTIYLSENSIRVLGITELAKSLSTSSHIYIRLPVNDIEDDMRQVLSEQCPNIEWWS